MSRVQLALNVSNLESAIAFYSQLFGVEPAKRLNHLGIEVETASFFPLPSSFSQATITPNLMKKVMFVCKKNSARSQMAESFAKQLGTGKIAVTSSGLEASQIHPEAIATMKDIGIDISSQSSKALSQFNPEDFDIVVSLCGCGVNLPPQWTQREVFADWQLDDPAVQPEIFPRVRDEIRVRVAGLIESLGV
jgi:arsenate reductase (thioredoxin)